MERFLILVRHAKSSWDDAGLQDFDRPLNKRGLKNAPEMGKRFANRNLDVDAIISSPANRAITTAELIANEISFDKKDIIQNSEIYEADLSTLVNVVTGIDDKFNHVILVGHNPSFTYLCNYLSDAQLANMPTCSMAHIKFKVETWNDITKHSGELIEFDFPKNK